MQLSKQEYDVIMYAIEEVEKLKQIVEREFDEYCMNISHCSDCALYKNNYMECTAQNYFNLKDKGEI